MAGIRTIVLAAALCATLAAVHGIRHTRLVSGSAARIENATWLVQFLYDGGEERHDGSEAEFRASHITCSGNIVDETHIVTAAHCFMPGSVYVSDPQKHVRVLAGSTDKLTGGELYEIEKLAVHPNYKPTATETHAKWDIAVVTLKTPLQFSDKVKPIKVAPDSYFEKAFTGGWGKANSGEGLTFAPTLTLSEYKYISRISCQLTFEKKPGYSKDDSQVLLCLKPEEGQGILCGGDSGTGVWRPEGTNFDGGNKEPELFGIAQATSGACDPASDFTTFVDLSNLPIKEFLIENGVPGVKINAGEEEWTGFNIVQMPVDIQTPDKIPVPDNLYELYP